MKRTFIIAEAGVNHNGSVSIAKQLIDAAAYAGVDCVKFQTFKAENIVTKYAQKANYQQRNMDNGSDSQYAMLKKLELSYDAHLELMQHCKIKGIQFLSTAFDLDSIQFLESLNLEFWKIPSGEITNYPYLRQIAKSGKKIILSTGMATLTEISDAIAVLEKFGTSKDKITLLHCTTEYPAPKDEINLRAMGTLQEHFGLPVGYSDHTKGIEIPVAAVAMGACVIEKHFTLDRNMEGPDHKASIVPDELAQMVQYIRNVEVALGEPCKEPGPSEKQNIPVARKSIVAAVDIAKGETFSEENLTTKRPFTGISPMNWESVIGAKAKRDFASDEAIEI